MSKEIRSVYGMVIPRVCMLRFPLSSISYRIKSEPEHIRLILYRPAQPELHFFYQRCRTGIWNLCDTIEKYKKGYCHMCASFGELCIEGRQLKDRQSPEFSERHDPKLQ